MRIDVLNKFYDIGISARKKMENQGLEKPEMTNFIACSVTLL